MAAALEYTCRGRNPRTVVILICIYTALAALIVLFGAAPWLMGLLALVTLPALWDLWTDPSAGLTLDGQSLRWHSGRREGQLRLDEIDHMRFDTRWDLSVRVSTVLKTEKRLRLPHECLPPHRELEAAFQERGVRVERHHFTVF